MLSLRKTPRGHRLKAEASSIAQCDWVEGTGHSESMQTRHLHNYLQQEAWYALTSILSNHQGILKDSINCHLQTIIIYSESPDANEPPYALPCLSSQPTH